MPSFFFPNSPLRNVTPFPWGGEKGAEGMETMLWELPPHQREYQKWGRSPRLETCQDLYNQPCGPFGLLPPISFYHRLCCLDKIIAPHRYQKGGSVRSRVLAGITGSMRDPHFEFKFS